MDGYSDYERLTISRGERILTVALKGTTEMNLIDGEMHREVSEVFSEIRLDTETNVVILRGDGDRAFTAGGSMEWFLDMNAQEKDAAIAEGRRIVIDMLEVPQPIVAALHGPVFGLGATLALFSDIVVASDDALIADPHVVIGIVAGDGGAIIWPWLLGINRAKEFLLTGDRVDAAKALELGLVNRVVPKDELNEAALKLARKLARNPRFAVQATKHSVNKLLRDAANQVLDTSLALERQSMDSKEHKAAAEKFLAAKAG